MSETNSKNPVPGNVKEIRFAVVMYGGVSLAIYINGVAQELFNMVRSTARGVNPVEFETTDLIYRKISYLLATGKLPAEGESIEAFSKNLEDQVKAEEKNNQPKIEFIIDILSGASAGGINGIFLAKALANNQSFEQLKNLWLDEGGIEKLLNDKKSVADIDLSAPTKPKSLLNSQRMYLKLLEALEGMGQDSEADSQYAKELDLFVTVTDFAGVPVPLRLLDKVVHERRYRHVFHFRYERDKDKNNDFTRIHNPMLAFAARATSSFPFAFEPMRLSEAGKIIEEVYGGSDEKKTQLEMDAERFFTKIKDQDGDDIVWNDRDLIDGGALDNKPFSYVIDALSQRRADFQVERNLIYVEPSPEIFNKKDGTGKSAPDALENAKAALTELPGYETIREDLQRVLERNRLIERVNRLINNFDTDVYTYLDRTNPKNWNRNPNETANGEKPPLTAPGDGTNEGEPVKTGDYWEKQGLEGIVQLKSHAALPYYRLRIGSLIDDIAEFVARKVGIEKDSEYFAAIRILVRFWRVNNFDDYKTESRKTVLAFLRRFDMSFRLRRLRFVQQKAAQLFYFDERFQAVLKDRREKLSRIRKKQFVYEEKQQEGRQKTEAVVAPTADEKANVKSQSFLAVQAIMEKPMPSPAESAGRRAADGGQEKNEDEAKTPSEIIWEYVGVEDAREKEDRLNELREIVNYFQERLTGIFEDLQESNESLRARKSTREVAATADTQTSLEDSTGEEAGKLSEELSRAINSIKLSAGDLETLLKITGDKTEELDSKRFKEVVENFIDEKGFRGIYEQIEVAAEKLGKLFDRVFEASRTGMNDLLKSEFQNIDLANAVRGYLRHYYESFDDYDQVSFPIFYETLVGEAARVNVLRISPRDANSLVNEEEKNWSKLAGNSLYHFGGFLDRGWRQNDIMWGRLDGAERLITALLPDEKYEAVRRQFFEEANRIILKEELLASNVNDLQDLLAQSLVNASAGIEVREAIGKVIESFDDKVVKDQLLAALASGLTDEQIVKFVKEYYPGTERRLEPKDLLKTVSRSTQIMGNIFEGIADKNALSGDRLRWISRLGQVFWGLVEVAAPNSFWNLLFLHWLKLFYAFEVVLIVGSTIFVKPDVQQFGIVLLILTLVTHLTVTTLSDYMRGSDFLRLLRFMAIGLMLVLMLSGAVFIFAFFFQRDLWESLVQWQGQVSGSPKGQRLFPAALLVMLFAALFAWRERTNPNIRIIGWVTLGFVVSVIVVGTIFERMTVGIPKYDGLGAGLALEFARAPGQINEIAGDYPSAARSALKKTLMWDTFLFIPLYTAFLLFFSRLLNTRRGGWVKWTLAATTVLIIAAGLADLSENYFSYLALSTNAAPQWMVSGISTSAFIKWGLLAATTGILSLIFWRKGWAQLFAKYVELTKEKPGINTRLSGRKVDQEGLIGELLVAAGVFILFSIIFIGLLLAAVTGFVGLFNHRAIIYFMSLQVIVLLVIGLVFIIMPGKFNRD